jgi:hypothetical protein
MTDQERDRNDPETPEDLATAGYPAMPPLDAVDPDLEQEGEKADPPESGWAGAAGAAEGEADRDRDR